MEEVGAEGVEVAAATVDEAPAEVVRFRPRWQQLPWFGLLGCLPITSQVLFRDAPVGYLVVVATAYAASLLWVRNTGVALSPDALVAYGLRTRRIPWRDIAWIGPDIVLTERKVGVRTRDDYIRLRAPSHWRLGPDPDFAAKAWTIYEYWVRYRGADWRPPPDAWRPAT